MAEELKPKSSFLDEKLFHLKQIFPEAFQDDKPNFEVISEILGMPNFSNEKEFYGINWLGKKESRRIASKPHTGTLKLCAGEGIREENAENLFLEGENLEVLKILRKSYAGKIKVIYIDPPYNTGNDFVYKDDFSDSTEEYLAKSGELSDEGLLVSNPKSSGKYHANWMSFMYPRLRLAKDFLKEDGVIFISIDDNEVVNLRLLCNEIFGEENFVGQITVLTNPKGRVLDKYFATCHEYLLCFSKSVLPAGSLSIDKNESELAINFGKSDDDGSFRELELRNTHREFGKHNRPNLFYPLYVDTNSGKVSLKNEKQNVEEVYPLWDDGYKGCWTWGQKKAEDNIALLVGRKVKDRWKIYRKSYTGDADTKKLKSIWDDKIFHTEKGQKIFSELFESKDKIFQSPKSVDLISTCIEMAYEPNMIVLDFFAGSGTTAHAVINLVADKKYKISFICVQIPEQTDINSNAYKENYKFISDITNERIRRVIKQSSNKAIGFKKLKLDRSTIYKWQDFDPGKSGGIFELSSQLELALRNPLIDSASSDDLITEVILQEGFPLTSHQEKLKGDVVKVTSDEVPYALFVSWSNKLDEKLVKSIDMNETDHFICLDKAFGSNNSFKQTLDNRCKLFTI